MVQRSNRLTSDDLDAQVDDCCVVDKISRTGTVMFVGVGDVDGAEIVGVELDEPHYDGIDGVLSANGVQYFSYVKGHVMFVAPDAVRLLGTGGK